MKKFIRLFLIFIFCITSLCGCGNDSDSCSPLDVSKHSAINTDYSATVPSENDAVADEGSSDDDDMIYITSVEKTHNYYPIIKNATFNSDNIEFYKIKGSYFQMICSYKELQKIIVTPSNIDPVIFEENYIICISRSAGIGYYDFKYENGKYSISADSYSQYNHGGKPEISEVFTSQSIDFIIVPKTEVEYIDGFQELCVNRFQKNGRQLDFIEYDTAAALPNKAQVWKLTSGSDLIEEYGLTFNDINVEYDNSVLIFLPDEPTSDFLITEMKIENGNLYLTVEEYVNNNNLYLKKHDVKFYLLNGIDIGALNESFKVNVKVEAVNIPLVPVVEIPTNVDVTDAILIAQEHFFHTFAIELPKGYIYTAKLTKETEKYWQITVFDKGMNEQYSGFCTDEYVYSIHKTSGEILEIKIVDRTPITKEEAIDVAKNYFHKHYQQNFDDNAEYYATDDMYDDSWMVTVISEKVRFVILVDELTAEITDIIFEQTEE